MENPIKMDDLGVPLFLETPISVCLETASTISDRLQLSHVFLEQLASTLTASMFSTLGILAHPN